MPDPAEVAARYVEVLRRVAHAEGPNQVELLLSEVRDDVARALRADPYGFADALGAEHGTLEWRRRSWDERDAAWQRQRSYAKAEIAVMQEYIEVVLAEAAVAHRRRTKEATLRLPSGTAVKTTEYKELDVRISDAGAFMAALGDEPPAGMMIEHPATLSLAAAKAYAAEALIEGGTILPGVEVLPAGRITTKVTHSEEVNDATGK